jgi:hypothetical protein
MAIQVRCPNDTCGKLLSIRDDFAGKTGQCPSCGATLPIPHPEPANGPAQPKGGEEPVLVYPEKPEAEQDEDAEDFEERPRRRRHTPTEPTDIQLGGESPVVGTLVGLGFGIGLLGFLSVMPFFAMYTIKDWDPVLGSGDRSPPAIGGMIQLPEGMVILIPTAVAGILCLASFISVLTLPARVADFLVTLSGTLAVAWSLTLVCWLIGYIAEIIMLKSFVEAPDNFDWRPGTMAPGLALWLGMGMAMLAVFVFAILLAIRGRTLWLSLAGGLGLVGGTLVVVLLVRPWDHGPMLTSGQRHKQPLRVLESKFAKRYWPLNSTFPRAKQKLELEDRLVNSHAK